MFIRDDNCHKAVRVFGAENQERMAQEEMGELLTALNHLHRGRCDIDAVREEIADVLITVTQLAYIYGEHEVYAKIDAKLARLGEVATKEAWRKWDEEVIQHGGCPQKIA